MSTSQMRCPVPPTMDFVASWLRRNADMNTPPKRLSSPVRYVIFGLLILAAGISLTALAIYVPPGLSALSRKPAETQPPKGRLAVELVEDIPHTLSVPERVRKALGIDESMIAHPPT